MSNTGLQLRRETIKVMLNSGLYSFVDVRSVQMLSVVFISRSSAASVRNLLDVQGNSHFMNERKRKMILSETFSEVK